MCGVWAPVGSWHPCNPTEGTVSEKIWPCCGVVFPKERRHSAKLCAEILSTRSLAVSSWHALDKPVSKLVRHAQCAHTWNRDSTWEFTDRKIWEPRQSTLDVWRKSCALWVDNNKAYALNCVLRIADEDEAIQLYDINPQGFWRFWGSHMQYQAQAKMSKEELIAAYHEDVGVQEGLPALTQLWESAKILAAL